MESPNGHEVGNDSPKRRALVYVLLLLLFIGPVIVTGLTSLVFLLRSGELLELDEVVEKQVENGAFYGNALRDNEVAYKLALFKHHQPEVVVLGSSRALQIRDQFFTVPFVNMGRAMTEVESAAPIIETLIAGPKPKLLIISVDFWWFNPTLRQARLELRNSREAIDIVIPRSTSFELIPKTVFAPIQWVRNGLISARLVKETILGVKKQPARLGVGAVNGKILYAPDGSFVYYWVVGSAAEADEPSYFQFRGTLRDTALPTGYFAPADRPDEVVLEQFNALLARAQAEGIATITFLAPLAPPAYDSLMKPSDRTGYLNQLRQALFETNSYHRDYLDPSQFDSPPCEFADGMHGGEITYLRILVDIAEDSASGLHEFFDSEAAEEIIEKYSGRAMVPNPQFDSGLRESDFLGLGCVKTP